MADKKSRNIVHLHPDDDLVVHLEAGLVLLTRSRWHGYTVHTDAAPTVTFVGIALRTIGLDPARSLQVAEVQPEHVSVAVDQLKAPELPLLKD